MRKLNSTFKTCFLSEAGSELENNDYFAFVELDQYACYVAADGLNEVPDAQSARLAIQTVLLAFQEHPSLRKTALRSYLKAGNQALQRAEGSHRLKASITVVVTDYVAIRYAHAGNTRFRMYRDGIVREQSKDMSLAGEQVKEQKMAADVLARHEQRNNLYTWLGQGKGFKPYISGRIKLVNGDILTLYTRGIWENLDGGELDDVFTEAKDDPQECLDNIEDMLLSRQPGRLENYTFASIFVDKIFLDPDKKRRVKKIVTVSLIAVLVIAAAVLVLWFLDRKRQERTAAMEQGFSDMIEYIEDNNYIRAGEEGKEALEAAEKLKNKEKTEEISAYRKLIEAVNQADDTYAEGKYEEAQTDYVTALNRSRQADRVADVYIGKQLTHITDYLSVFDYIQLGDSLSAQGDYGQAEEKYLQAKRLATQNYFEEGRKEAMEALEKLYTDRNESEEADSQEAKEKASEETGAAELMGQGDKAFTGGDYEGARVYYVMAQEKYRELGDADHGEMIDTKIASIDSKLEEQEEKRVLAEEYVQTAKGLEEAGELPEAKKQYLMAKDVYAGIQDTDKVTQMESKIAMLDVDIGAGENGNEIS